MGYNWWYIPLICSTITTTKTYLTLFNYYVPCYDQTYLMNLPFKHPNPHRFPAAQPLRGTRSLGLGPFRGGRPLPFRAQAVAAAAAEACGWAVAGAAVGAELGRGLLGCGRDGTGAKIGGNSWISHRILEETMWSGAFCVLSGKLT